MVFKKNDLRELNYVAERKNNYYCIELEVESYIEYIKLYLNEKFLWDTLKNLVLEYSDDGLNWKEFGKFKVYNSEFVDFEFGSKYIVKFLRLYFSDYCNFDIEKIKIYSRKQLGLMVAARADGLGARLLPLLNAYVFSKKLGFKFGYTWHNWESFSWFKSIEQVDDNKIAHLGTGKEEQIFNREFIDNYSYTNVFEWNRGYMERITLEELKTAPYDQEWGWFVSQNLARQINPDDIKSVGYLFKEAWSEIGFASNIKSIIELSQSKAESLKGFIAIHIRGGDGVFNLKTATQQDTTYLKMMPLEIAMELIEANMQETIVLFGDDFNEVVALKEFYSKTCKIFAIEEFVKSLRGIERNFFEISFMSRANKIYSGHSSFARIASYIGLGDEPTYYYKALKWNIIYAAMKKNLHKIKTHPLQKAYSAYFLFCVATRLTKKDEALRYLHLAYSCNPNNALYVTQLLVCYYEYSHFDKAKLFLEKIKFDERLFDDYCNSAYFKANHQKLIELTKAYPNNQMFRALAEYIFKKFNIKEQQNQPTLQPKVITKEVIKEKPIPSIYLVSAKDRIHNHLAYKLGSAMILNSKSLLGYIRMPYVLSYIKEAHQKEQKEYQVKITKNPKLKLPKLESYADYKEALKEKECFTYKLGEALIKANSVRGGGRIFAYLAFFKEVRRLRRELREKRK